MKAPPKGTKVPSCYCMNASQTIFFSCSLTHFRRSINYRWV